MKRTIRTGICILLSVCMLLSVSGFQAFADNSSGKIVLTAGRSNYELPVNGGGSYLLPLPTSVAAGKITAVPNPSELPVTVTIGDINYSVNDANTFDVTDGMEIIIKVGTISPETYSIKVMLSVYEEIKALIRAIESGKNVPAMLNALKPRYEALPDWAKELVSNRNLLGYEPAPKVKDEGTGKIVLDGGRTIYEIELIEGIYEYSQDIASSFSSISISGVPHEDGDEVTLNVGAKSYSLDQKIPLENMTEVIITITGNDRILAYKINLKLSVNEEINALNSGIAVIASSDMDLRFKNMVTQLLIRYNALDNEAKTKVINGQALLDAKDTIDRLEKTALEIAAAAEKTIKDLNDGITSLKGRELTLEDQELVNSLMDLYDLLTFDEKEKVIGYTVLEEATVKINGLEVIPNPSTGDGGTFYLYSVLALMILLAGTYITCKRVIFHPER